MSWLDWILIMIISITLVAIMGLILICWIADDYEEDDY